jgi:hypothetical protein
LIHGGEDSRQSYQEAPKRRGSVKGKVGERVDKAHNDSQEFFFLRFWCHNFFHSSISKHSKDFMLIWSFFLLVILFQSAGNDFKELLGRGACGKIG